MSAQTHVRFTRTGVALAVGIIILTIALIAGLLYVKDRGEQARKQETIKVAEENLQSQSNKDVALSSGTDENKTASGSESQANSQNSEQKDASAQGQGAESTTDTKNNGTSSNSNTSDSSSNSSAETNSSASSVATELPQTGAADAFWIVALGAVAFAGVSYVRSKQALAVAQN